MWNFFGSFHSLSDALKSLFARHRLLFVGYDPEDEGFRHLFSEIARFRVGATEGCYLATTDTVLPTVRWAQRKALRLIDAEPASFIALLEETITDRRRQTSASRVETTEAPLPTAVRSLLEVMVEPLSRSLAAAPVEEEEVTPETATALERARASLARGERIPHQDILREFRPRQMTEGSP